MRLNKPLPILLLLWPTCWALLLSDDALDFNIWSIFIFGIIISRTLGCVINDLLDRKIDSNVFRTKNRPLANGEIKAKHAIFLIIILCFLDLIIALNLNLYAFLLSFVALALMIFYPFSKRFFPCPQLILGSAFNWGIIMAYAQTQNTIPLEAWHIYFIATCWTISYDTIYALSDIFDDIRLKINSSARLFGNNLIGIIAFFEALMLLGLLIIGFKHGGSLAYGVLLFACGAWMMQQLYFLNIYIKKNVCHEQSYISNISYQNRVKFFITEFQKHHWVGFCVFIAFCILKFF
tara:strand:+ start:458 stop:1333 length:876 start_codon:yes stop_codon:yes gene_type:complete